jgi:hypothetical protein
MLQVIEHDSQKAKKIIQKLSPAPKCATGRTREKNSRIGDDCDIFTLPKQLEDKEKAS